MPGRLYTTSSPSFPGLVRRANEKKLSRKINRRRAKTGSEARGKFSRGADLFFWPISFRSRDGLSWERGTTRRAVSPHMDVRFFRFFIRFPRTPVCVDWN